MTFADKVKRHLQYHTRRCGDKLRYRRFYRIHRKFETFTMVPAYLYVANLALSEQFQHIAGAVVECGVWRGGMIAGMADLLGNQRHYHLFDSFEGLPPAKNIDGPAALKWQGDTESPEFHDNCRADVKDAETAMNLAGAKHIHISKGWFEKTLSEYSWDSKIAVLRLDGDWYDSIITCLNCLYSHVADGGLILLDDYYFWDGNSRAVHDFLSQQKSADRIRQYKDLPLAYIVKNNI